MKIKALEILHNSSLLVAGFDTIIESIELPDLRRNADTGANGNIRRLHLSASVEALSGTFVNEFSSLKKKNKVMGLNKINVM